MPRLEAPAPTAAIPSAIPQASEPARIQREGAGNDASPAPASAALLGLAALLLGGGGVVVGPPGLAGRLVAHLRERLGWDRDREGSELQGPAGGIGASPRLVPLTVVEDAHERAGRILPPT
ncbi:MAG TPA: hypothetical protein VIX40_11055 [Methylomirabilota bacterium]